MKVTLLKKVKLLKQIQKPVFSVGGDDLGKHYEIIITDVNGTSTFTNFELVEVGGDHVWFKKGNCSVQFGKEHNRSDGIVKIREWGTPDERHRLYNMRIADNTEFNAKDIKVGHDYKIDIAGARTISGRVDSVQHNAINIVFLDYNVHDSDREKTYVLKRLVLRCPEVDDETGKIKMMYAILYESDMRPSLNETPIFADDITIEEI